MEQNQVLQLTCAKHIKIYKLHKLGLSNKDIATVLGTNVGHVYNVLKEYQENPERVGAADAVTTNGTAE